MAGLSFVPGYGQETIEISENEIVLFEKDTIVDLSGTWISYIDEPPYDDAQTVLNNKFQNINTDEISAIWKNSINKIFWFRIKITNGEEKELLNHKLFCGYVDRMFLYEIINGRSNLIVEKGIDRNKRDYQLDVQYNDFSISLPPKSSREFLIHISSAFATTKGENINLSIVKRGYENNLNSRSKIAKEIGLGFLAVLSIIFAFMMFAFVMSFLNKDRVTFAFGLLCLSFILYYLRDLEVMIQEISIYPAVPDFNTISEPITRSLITGSFTFFTFTYFQNFYKRNIVKKTSIAICLLGFVQGLWFLFGGSTSPMSPYTAFDGVLYFGYIILEQINSFVVITLLWSSTSNYSRFYIIGTLVFILSNYGGLFLGLSLLSTSQIQYIESYTSLLGTLVFTLLIAYMLIRRAIAIEGELRARNTQVSQLYTLDKIKSEFYTNITHEFRTPLTVILGMASNLNGQLKEKSLITKNGNRLLQLVNQMLDLSKAKSGKLEFQYAQSDVVAFIKHIANSYATYASQQQIELSFVSTHDKIIMDFDPSRLEQVVTNLISNAIKHTSKNGEIKIEVTKSKANLHCMVKDNGKGIATQDLPYVFERYYQSQESNLSNNNHEGTGIGLSIVKQLVMAMNGTVDVKSKLYKGSTFMISIPITNESRAKAPHNYQSPNVSASVPITPQPVNTSNTAQEKSDILIVEDNQDVSDYVVSCLQDQYNTLTAREGQQGLRMAQEHSPDLIISDVMMPTMDGYQMTRAIRKDDQCNHIPIILLTAKASKSEVIEGLAEGADDYLTKPFDRQELLLRVNNILESRRRYALKNQLIIQSPVQSPELHPWLQKFRDLIIEHIDEEITGEWLSQHLFLSRSQIHRKLQSLANVSTTEYIKQIRLQQARKLLMETELSIEEISHKVGFKSASHFSTSFKAAFDQNPSALRKDS